MVGLAVHIKNTITSLIGIIKTSNFVIKYNNIICTMYPCFIPSRQATPDGHISKHPMGISQEILSMNTLHKVPTSIVFKISRILNPGILQHLFHKQDLTLNLQRWSDEYYITIPICGRPLLPVSSPSLPMSLPHTCL